MNRIKISIICLIFFSLTPCFGQITPVEKGLQSITPDVLKAQLGFLASDWMEGRMAGEKGEFISSDYIAGMLQLFGVKPGGDYIQSRTRDNKLSGIARSYFQNFVLLKTSAGDEQFFGLKLTDGGYVKTINFTQNVDFAIRSADRTVEIEAPVVFAGYGFKNDKFKYNDFNKLNVKGKFLLKVAGIPKFIKDSSDPEANSTYEKEIESTAKALGAIGIIEFNPLTTVVGNPLRSDFLNMSPSEGTPRTGRLQARFSIPEKKVQENFIRILISVKAANEILNGTGIDVDDYIKNADANKSFQIASVTNRSVTIKSSVKTSRVAVRNVIGIIEGKNPDQVIVLGAHYDHMGMGNGYIWNGADDNASGTVGVMTLARAIMATGEKPEKTIIIALWTAEEEGLLGSRYFVQNPTVPLKNIKLNVNFDMISRYISENEPNKVTMTYTNAFPGFKDITQTCLQKYGINLTIDYQPSADPPGGSDHRSFVEAGLPVLRFKPGHREEYHKPDDETGTVNWDIMEKIVKLSFADVWELANRSDW
jgi:hypothetical protein